MPLFILPLALTGWRWARPQPGRFNPWDRDRVHFVQGAGWASRERSGLVQKIWPPPGFNQQTVELVAIRFTDYTTLSFWNK